MRKIKCNKKRQCGLDKMPPVMDTSTQYGSGGLTDQEPEYLYPLKSINKTGSVRKNTRKPMTGGRKKLSSPRKRNKSTSKKSTQRKPKKGKSKKQKTKQK